MCSTMAYKAHKIIISGIGVLILISLGVFVGASIDSPTSDVLIESNNDEKDFPYKKIRLPGNVIPIKYRVYLHPNITDGKFEYHGDVKILVEIKADTDSIILHSKHLKIENTELFKDKEIKASEDHQSNKIKIDGTVEDRNLNFLMVKVGTTLPAGTKYVLHIKFAGSLSSGLEGFYKSMYKTKEGEKRYLASTQFESTGARKAFPCFDEPAMKAKFSIIMVRQQDHVALSNMPVEKEVHRNDGLVIDHFEESVKMSTYLVAFAVSDYVSLEATTKRGIKVRVWAPKDQISQARFAIHCAPLILEYFERFFNVKFPLPKQDLIAIPDFAAGAMENWGLITYRMTAILYDEKESSSLNKQWVAVVIAHELAHQWFGNLVTMKWWNDLWLNEGFASFVQYIGANLVDKGWRMNDQFLIDSLESSLVYDSHLNSHPISVKIEDPAQINEMFDSISYGKGASIIRMMQDFLGGDTFHTGLLNYLKKYQFSNAASEDLWKCMTEATGGKINVKQVMDTWTLQMGYPVINVARNRKGDGSAILTQEHFLTDSQDGSKTPKRKSPFNYKWDVPLTYYFQHHTEKQSQWFHTGNESIVIPWNRQYGWMKLNSDQKGFYRVNYDKENWRALSDQLMKNHEILSEADRANLIDDAFELGKAGYIDEVQALELTQYLENETAYVPFASALSSLGYIGGNLNLRPGYKFFEKYMLKQVSPLAKELGWEDKGSHLHKLLRASVLQKVVYHNDSESVKIARKMFSDWMINKTWIPPNLRSIIYFAGIKYGGEKEWNYMYNMYQHSPYPSEKEKLMYSLTMTADKRLLRRFLKWSLNPNIIRSQDACAVISAIAGNPSGTAMAIKFVKDNWHTIYTRFASGSFEAARLIKGTFGRLKSKKGLEETEKFFTTHPAGTGKLAVKQSIAQIRNHIEWLEKNERKVESWLENQTKRKRA